MRRERSKTHPAAHQPRRGRPSEEKGADTYGLRGKLPDPTVCSDCGAMFRRGRWVRDSAPADAHRTLCPACHRIRDDYPGGLVTVEGAFAASHFGEIEALARHVAEREERDHPLQRIMRVTRVEADRFEIATTDKHLARGIGEALHHAYQGELESHYGDAEQVLRVRWRR